MKKLILSLFLFCALSSYAQVQEGEIVPNITFPTVLNAPLTSASLSDMQGKIILIDFWATWCGSCLDAMPHLNKLQQKYAGKLQVMAVTDESAKRTRQFLASRPSNLWFASDTGRILVSYFAHRLIPHTVLISPSGILIANTSPEAVTDAVIDSILNGQQVHLSLKKDLRYTSREDLIKDTFPTADTVKSRFLMDGELPGAPGLSTLYRTDTLWNGRRFSAMNCNLKMLYMMAFGDFPFERTIDSIPRSDKKPKYRVDLIVQRKADLLPTLQHELKKRFDVQAKIVQQVKEVYILKIADKQRFEKIPINVSGTRTYAANHGAIDQHAITMKDFAEFLESYGVDKLVVDETHNKGKFDIAFTFQPEDPQSLFDQLAKMGLKLDKGRRKIDMLKLYKL